MSSGNGRNDGGGNRNDGASSAQGVNQPRSFMSTVDVLSLNDEQRGFITAVRLLEEEIVTQQISGEQITKEMAEMFPPAVFFSTAIQTTPSISR